MKHHPFLLRYAVLLLALVALNPASQAATRKARPAQKEHAVKAATSTAQEDFEKRVALQITDLKTDIDGRATWAKLQEVKKEADENAGKIKMVMFSAAAVGFVFGCVVTFLVARKMGGPAEGLKIT